MAEFLHRHSIVFARAAILLIGLILIAGLQASAFFARYTPRFDEANVELHALIVETAKRQQYVDIARQLNRLAGRVEAIEGQERSLADAWQDFQAHFLDAPEAAIAELKQELPILLVGSDLEPAALDDLLGRLDRLQSVYADHYKPLLDEMRDPPLYLWPTAAMLANRSGYLRSAKLNRALYLAQTGDIGTARVMLAGLNASVDDERVLGTILYTLGRLQFELFREMPEVEYYTQSLQYLRQSLAADPESQRAKRLLDFLLSLPQAATAPQSAEGRPENPSEGEGAAISAEKRIF